MQKKFTTGLIKGWLFISGILIVILSTAYQINYKFTTPIVLQNEPRPILAKDYSILNIVDERTGKIAFASLLPETAAANASNEKADLQGGTLNAVRNFVRHNLTNGNHQRQMMIGIRQLKITEIPLSGNRAQGHVVVELSLNIKHGEDTTHLIDYRGGMHYSRPIANMQVIEPSLRRSLMNGLRFFDQWITREADHSAQLATAVQLHITNYTEQNEGDTIYYSVNRPLRWDDFRDKPYGSRYAASVFPSFGFNLHQQVTGGIIKVDLAMKVYVPKSACWVKEYSRTPTALQHEQRHFDIVKIISERYKRQLLSTPLPVNDYEGIIHAAYYKFFHQMNEMQDAYDDETQHGMNTSAQAKWESKIEDELQNMMNPLATKIN